MAKCRSKIKNLVLLFLTAACCVFSSCTADTSGFANELVSEKWQANLDGGASVYLEFSNDTATLKISNADSSTEIKGKYTADDNSFVIFVPDIGRNYTFSYTPSKSYLELTYDGNTIKMDKVS